MQTERNIKGLFSCGFPETMEKVRKVKAYKRLQIVLSSQHDKNIKENGCLNQKAYYVEKL
jgi:hypothetical protein